jgi:hypothetical protein
MILSKQTNSFKFEHELRFPILQYSAADVINVKVIIRSHRGGNQRWRNPKEKETFNDNNGDVAGNIYIDKPCLRDGRV